MDVNTSSDQYSYYNCSTVQLIPAYFDAEWKTDPTLQGVKLLAWKC